MCTSEPSKLIICVLYRPPSAPIADFRACLESVHEYTHGRDDYEVCLLGDFNFPNMTWDPQMVTSSNPSTDAFEQFMGEQFLSQYILQPTRQNNILDLFLAKSAALVTHVNVSLTKLSDHNLVEVYMSYNPCQPNVNEPPIFEAASFRSLDYSKADFDSISDSLVSHDWATLLEEHGLEDFPKVFTAKLLSICREHCPLKLPPRRKGSTKMRVLSRKKRKLQRRLESLLADPSSSKDAISDLEDRIALLHYDIRDTIVSERLYKEGLAVGKVRSNPKYFYSYAKRFSKQKQSISMLFDEEGSTCTDPKQIANILKNQFSSVFSRPEDADMTAADFADPLITREFKDTDLSFTEEDVISAIEDIKADAAAGPDGIPAVLLKSCKHALARPIHLLWSLSFEVGKTPAYYKSSFICPLYKKGSHATASNYRPVSLTSHIVKTFERVLRKRLVDYLESNGLLCSQQHGFRSGHSCLTQLLHHFDDILENFLEGKDTDCIYLDYAKAFDKVDHALLLKKMTKYGIHPRMIKWIESFLTDRSQQVVVDGHLSLAAIIISGVPQGTVLGPILFLIFINDITLCLSESIARSFADDTRIMKAISGDHDMVILQNDLNAVTKWSTRNNMSLHEDKFEFISHAASRSGSCPTLQDLPFAYDILEYTTSKGILTPVDQLKDLGVTVSADLSWTAQVKSMASKARQKAGWVLSVFHTRSPTVMLTLYKSMVRSLIEYCCPLWHSNRISHIQELESVQRTFTARIAGVQHLDYWERLQKLSLMSLQRRRERYVLLHMWKIRHGQVSNDLRVSFVTRPRTGIKAVIPSLRKGASAHHQSLYDNSFAVMGPRLWNCLPVQLNSIETFDMFKQKLTSELLRIPDQPPCVGYTPPNSNSILDRKMEAATSDTLMGGQRSCWPS